MEETAKLRWDEKRHRNGQEAHEKILNKNANQNYNEVLPHISQNGHDQKLYKPINAKEGMEKREPSYTVGGNVNWQPLQSLCGSDGKESAMLPLSPSSLFSSLCNSVNLSEESRLWRAHRELITG